MDFRRCLIQAVVKRRIPDEFAGRALAILDRRHQIVEPHHGCARVVIELLVLRKFSKRALAAFDAIGDCLDSCEDLISPLVHGWIVEEPPSGTLAILDFRQQRVHRVHSVTNLPIQLVIRNEPADCSVTCVRVADQRCGFFDCQVRVVADGGIGHELAESAFALVDALGHLSELVAEHLEVCDEVVRSLHDLPYVSCFRAL